MFRAVLLACLLALPMALVAQQPAADSLIALLRAHPKQDTVRVDLLHALVIEVQAERPDTAVELTREELRIAKAIGDRRRSAKAALDMGVTVIADFDSAYFYYRLAADGAREAGDIELLAETWVRTSYLYLGDTYAPDNSTRAGMQNTALTYSDSAITAYASIGDTSNLVYNIARKGEILCFLKRLDDAHRTLHEALRLTEGMGKDDHGLSSGMSVYSALSIYHDYAGTLDSALAYTLKALEVGERMQWKEHIAYHRGRAAILLAQLGQYDRAIPMGEEALAYATDNHLPKERTDAMYTLYVIHELAGNWREALRWHKVLLAASDSTNAVMANETMDKLQVQLKSVKDRERVTVLEKDRVINEQKRARQRTALFALGGGILLLVALALVIQNRYRLKHRALKESEVQKAIIAKAHARSEELLLNILPEEVALELKEKGAAEAKHFDDATILFTDFKGFTQASERMSPQELVEELNTCFMAFDHIVTSRGIEKIKTIGDAYMCVGGLPDPLSSSPVDVVHAALEMQAFMKARKAERDVLGKPAFEMRVGIHTGPVVAGIVGVKKFQYDIWGDTVNTASRMESSGEVGQVNISEATYAVVKSEASFTFTSRGKVQAKGKGEMEMYFAERAL